MTIENEEMINLYLTAWILQIIGMISLTLIIPTFLISKITRTHPGPLIMVCCFIELSFYYTGFFNYFYLLSTYQYFSFNIYTLFKHWAKIFSFGGISVTEEQIMCYVTAFDSTMLYILDIYNICLCLDILLTIRNPFYSSARRMKYYHIFSILIPLLVFFPNELYSASNIYIYI